VAARDAATSAAEDGGAPRSWPRLYAAVIAFLAFQIALFYLFTRAFQ